jgi:hypothetical protein
MSSFPVYYHDLLCLSFRTEVTVARMNLRMTVVIRARLPANAKQSTYGTVTAGSCVNLMLSNKVSQFWSTNNNVGASEAVLAKFVAVAGGGLHQFINSVYDRLRKRHSQVTAALKSMIV